MGVRFTLPMGRKTTGSGSNQIHPLLYQKIVSLSIPRLTEGYGPGQVHLLYREQRKEDKFPSGIHGFCLRHTLILCKLDSATSLRESQPLVWQSMDVDLYRCAAPDAVHDQWRPGVEHRFVDDEDRIGGQHVTLLAQESGHMGAEDCLLTLEQKHEVDRLPTAAPEISLNCSDDGKGITFAVRRAPGREVALLDACFTNDRNRNPMPRDNAAACLLAEEEKCGRIALAESRLVR